MPFPLAHPAAVLPFRRYCPRFFNFPALVIGSLTPDLGYFFFPFHLNGFSHELLDGLIFCLPVGMFSYFLLYWLRSFAIRKLQKANVAELLQMSWPQFGSPLPLMGSLLVGAWTHSFLDSFTHESGWLTENLPFLQLSLGSIAGRSVKVYNVLWYASSFVGVSLVFLAYWHWQQELSHLPAVHPPQHNWRGALLVASAVLPIEFVHRLLNNWVGLVLVSILTLMLLLLVVYKTRPTETTLTR